MYMAFYRRMPHGLEEEYSARAQELADALGVPRLQSRALAVVAFVAGRTGRFEERIQLLREAEPTLGDMPMRDRWIHHCNIVSALSQLGRSSEARDEARSELSRLATVPKSCRSSTRPCAKASSRRWLTSESGTAPAS